MHDVTDDVLAAICDRDIERFMRCYARDARIEDGDGSVLSAGHAAIRQRYSSMFRDFPQLTVRKLSRLSAGAYVVQEEEVTGRRQEPERHLAVYRIANGLIEHERLLR